MAEIYTVRDCYNTACEILLEPYRDGTCPGLSLGIVTEQEFLSLFAVTLEDFINRTGLVWSIFTQQVNFGQSQYQNPNDINTVKVCFVGGQYIDHSTLQDIDDWIYNWQSQRGTPEYWHQDGLAPKTVEVVLIPNYSGSSYVVPTDPTIQPPFGIYGLFNGSTIGQFSGTLTVSGTTATWSTGDLFDTNWNNYYPVPSVSLNGTLWPVDSVASSTVLNLTVAPGDGSYPWKVNIGNDGNLSMVGTTGIDKIDYSLGDVIPVIPDDCCCYLAYGVMARIFSTDGEAKDMQRSYYCLARYTEGLNAMAAISGLMLEIG